MLALLLFTLAAPAQPAGAGAVTITVLATTDMHGAIYPHDYFTREPAARGLAAAATLIERRPPRRRRTCCSVDCGDTIQGSPLASVHQGAVRAGTTQRARPDDARDERAWATTRWRSATTSSTSASRTCGGARRRRASRGSRRTPVDRLAAAVRAVPREDGRAASRSRSSASRPPPCRSGRNPSRSGPLVWPRRKACGARSRRSRRRSPT